MGALAGGTTAVCAPRVLSGPRAPDSRHHVCVGAAAALAASVSDLGRCERQDQSVALSGATPVREMPFSHGTNHSESLATPSFFREAHRQYSRPEYPEIIVFWLQELIADHMISQAVYYIHPDCCDHIRTPGPNLRRMPSPASGGLRPTTRTRWTRSNRPLFVAWPLLKRRYALSKRNKLKNQLCQMSNKCEFQVESIIEIAQEEFENSVLKHL